MSNELFEMANVSKKDTKLPFDIWIDSEGKNDTLCEICLTYRQFEEYNHYYLCLLKQEIETKKFDVLNIL